MIRDLDHINIATDRLPETRAFFMDVLGMTERWRPAFPFDVHWLYVGDRPLVHLMARKAAGVGCDQAALSHIAFAIDDIDGMARRLTDKGVDFREIGAPGTPIRQLFLNDPNGVTIELNYLGFETARERSGAL
jgi:catechol 2,3-dioxygenase-like lactoylglutathione lyase family enzyme